MEVMMVDENHDWTIDFVVFRPLCPVQLFQAVVPRPLSPLRPGILALLFSEFCSGRRAQIPHQILLVTTSDNEFPSVCACVSVSVVRAKNKRVPPRYV